MATARVRTTLALGYWVLPNIFQYWVVLGIGQYFYWLSLILLGHLDTSCQHSRKKPKHSKAQSTMPTSRDIRHKP